jgi:hypothetical protein
VLAQVRQHAGLDHLGDSSRAKAAAFDPEFDWTRGFDLDLPSEEGTYGKVAPPGSIRVVREPLQRSAQFHEQAREVG